MFGRRARAAGRHWPRQGDAVKAVGRRRHLGFAADCLLLNVPVSPISDVDVGNHRDGAVLVSTLYLRMTIDVVVISSLYVIAFVAARIRPPVSAQDLGGGAARGRHCAAGPIDIRPDCPRIPKEPHSRLRTLTPATPDRSPAKSMRLFEIRTIGREAARSGRTPNRAPVGPKWRSRPALSRFGAVSQLRHSVQKWDGSARSARCSKPGNYPVFQEFGMSTVRSSSLTGCESTSLTNR